MDKQVLIDNINYFFNVIHDQMAVEDRLRALIHALDLLAAQYHQVSFTFDETDYPEPPEPMYDEKYKATYQMIGKQFPHLGYYNVIRDVNDNLAQSDISIGDAIDDLTDIYNELKKVLWYFENTSDANALFYFDLGYRTHWGKHLRELQLYLHEWISQKQWNKY